MDHSAQQIPHKVLLVDDDEAVRALIAQALELKGFEVVAAANLADALRYIVTESFDVLISDLHVPNPTDGLAVVTAMRHSHPDAVTMLVSGFPDVQSAMAAVFLEANEIIIKPFEIWELTDLVEARMFDRKAAARPPKERVGALLQRCVTSVVDSWLARAKQSSSLNRLRLSDEERTGHLPKLVEDLATRLGRSSASGKDSDAAFSPAAIAHGELRYRQNYTPAMLVHESRILQVAIFGALQNNLVSLDFELLLPDVMAIADEIDSQLTQSMESYMKLMAKSVAA
jgi:DNA-binding response OmpR family regulator